MTPAHTHDDHDDFGGLQRDLLATGVALDRRQLLRLAAGYGALQLLGCSASSVTAATSTTTTTASGSCTKIPEETAGPFPGDSSNGPNVLNLSGVVRRDIRTSFAGLSGTAAGIPLAVTLTIASATGSCAPLSDRAVYLWHCDRGGLYSLYSAGATNQNYLRGVQVTDANGQVSFTSIFPACYSGRWPHIHFEIYPSLASATSFAGKIATAQLALPKVTCDLVYATTGYQASVANLSQTSLTSDMVFSDGSTNQVATMSGDVASGFSAALTVPV